MKTIKRKKVEASNKLPIFRRNSRKRKMSRKRAPITSGLKISKSKSKIPKRGKHKKLISFSEYLNREKESQKSNGLGDNSQSLRTKNLLETKENLVGSSKEQILAKMKQSKSIV